VGTTRCEGKTVTRAVDDVGSRQRYIKL
jgi:hypothetical protein